MNVAIIAGMSCTTCNICPPRGSILTCVSVLSPLASSMFTPGIQQIADDLGVDVQPVIATTTGFVICLGVGPLIIAPLSETFGRKKLYIICFGIFALLQIPTALSPNVGFLIAMRTISGLFGSVGIANGGGSLSDMFPPAERAGIFGYYLLGPLLGPTLGPLFGGIIVQRLGWRWIYWVLAIVCAMNVSFGFFFLRETYAPTLLARRKKDLEEKDGSGVSKYRYEGEDERPMRTKLLTSFNRPLKILSHPIVMTMSLYQALIFGTTFSIYTNMQDIYGGEYGFSTEQIGLLFLFPGFGFLTAVWFLVPKIDTVYNALGKRHGGGRPEYRLPLANIGAVLIPISLFWYVLRSLFKLRIALIANQVRMVCTGSHTLGCQPHRHLLLWHRPGHGLEHSPKLLHRCVREVCCLRNCWWSAV